MNSIPQLKGQPSKLFILDYGLFKVHADDRVIGICGYLIETDAGETVIIDTGFPQRYSLEPKMASADDQLYLFGELLEIGPANMPAAQLERAGRKPKDIDLFILSHTHIDHVGHIDAFPWAPLLMSRPERELPKPLYWGRKQPLDWPDRDYLLVDDDTEIGPGFHVLLVPGHTIGQLAFLLELPNTGTVLLTSDAISRPAEIEERFATAPHPRRARASAERLMKLAEETDAFVIYGHDPEQWKWLKKAPDFYD